MESLPRPAVMGIMKTLPQDRHQPDAFEALCRMHDKDSNSVIYIDTWPFSNPLMIICSPVLAEQACSSEHDLSKPPMLKPFFEPLAGGINLFTANGSEWKHSRALFNSGFSASYILQQTSHLIDAADVYVNILRGHARKGDMFSLDDITLWYLMDVIGAVSLDSNLQSQTKYNPLASAMRSQIRWHVLKSEELLRWNPARRWVQLYNSYQMNNYIGKELDKRYTEWFKDETSSRSVIHLALKEYMAQQNTQTRSSTLDPVFKKWATIQIRLFLFAGHDSTSSTICYCNYMLEMHPEAMAKVRAEHDVVFKSVAETSDHLRQEPHLLNHLPYTTAVIKEAMRLYPPASAMRFGEPGKPLRDDRGQVYSTDGINLWILHSALQHHPKYWPFPLEFRPERWLVGPEDPLYPTKGGWRPFERGPRDCLGQTLAMLDLKATLVLTAREFEIRNAYDEWDIQHPTKQIKNVNGERAYLTQSGGAHPADGYPCRITFRCSHDTTGENAQMGWEV